VQPRRGRGQHALPVQEEIGLVADEDRLDLLVDDRALLPVERLDARAVSLSISD
jgi:hypothetical protein